MTTIVLTVAGSDPSGGAGIQADLKTFAALGAYGCAVLTSLTAQSTQGVTGVLPVPAAFVQEQVETLVADLDVAATKIGMLGTAEVARTVGDLCRSGSLPRVVLDPVMVSTAGSRLLDEDAIEEVRSMLPHVAAITPNLPEAAVLLGLDPEAQAGDVATMRDQALALRDLGAERVLLKGGHLADGDAVDVWADADGLTELRTPRVDTPHTHGTGCTLSSAITALVPVRDTWIEAVTDAKDWLTGALERGRDLAIGHGPGPVHHAWRQHHNP
ncbi:bifunctional hydroxymethylpyrimidine kinase/phosphomethylpyrimidine kinase [Serinicoccus sp. CUA-874]|uniref:bifunctional hydroxymethylpyrimidine kinase/phosphomethylpyrimidine kinase n=1 Tax=Serinicoccus sp. CUA-874 TaxID=1517939 RepID=UPI000965885C|nr:bifunctional hydroxymethylpyrimidine kinase/phosphomethylpyrimidine kinase [Serinicoccus sp. CUA-874]OLT16362.1 bifunctional hydroxymethylpyrimidine kinase/phosphomethylpyrimidine kinase [Serinicoccus sp. CUA-874]